jgi:PASTA domain
VAWQDTRDSGPDDIYGARVGADGSVVDQGGFPINRNSGYQVLPAVAFDGLNFLALWDESPYAPGLNVYATRLSVYGDPVLDPGGIPVSEAGTVLGTPAAVGGYPYHVGLAYDRVGSEPPWGGAQRIFLRDFSESGPPPPPPPQPPPPISPPPPQPPPPPVRCRVPRVIGLRLATAKRRIRRAHCSVGRVRRKHSRPRLRGRVVSQSPHRGSVRRRGYPVRLLVGRL